MKVKIINRPLRSYPVGHVLEVGRQVGRRLIHAHRAELVEGESLGYQTRMMAPQTAPEPVHAPYGFKADGTPRLRPGRPAKAE